MDSIRSHFLCCAHTHLENTLLPQAVQVYSVLTHEVIISAACKENIVLMLRALSYQLGTRTNLGGNRIKRH
jgi:hypothetical protein